MQTEFSAQSKGSSSSLPVALIAITEVARRLYVPLLLSFGGGFAEVL